MVKRKKKRKLEIITIKGKRYEVASRGSQYLPAILIARPIRKKKRKKK